MSGRRRLAYGFLAVICALAIILAAAGAFG